MEVVYLLTAEIPSEFHCAQITTFHMQHVSKHLTTVMGRKIEFPKIDNNTQKVVDRMSEFSDMVSYESLDLKKETDSETTKLNKTNNENGIWNVPNFIFNLIIAIIASLIVWIVSIVF